MSEIRHVLEFWFAPANKPRWFNKDAAFDDEITRRFEDVHERAATGRLAAWQNTPQGSMALVLCLDQLDELYLGSGEGFQELAGQLMVWLQSVPNLVVVLGCVSEKWRR